jgi:AbrB family looped-hinge helix DNA binding protein
MNSTGIVRRIDDLGRIIIPKEIRRMLQLSESDPLEIFVDLERNQITMQPYNQPNYREMWEDLKKRKHITKEDIEEIEKYHTVLK